MDSEELNLPVAGTSAASALAAATGAPAVTDPREVEKWKFLSRWYTYKGISKGSPKGDITLSSVSIAQAWFSSTKAAGLTSRNTMKRSMLDCILASKMPVIWTKGSQALVPKGRGRMIRGWRASQKSRLHWVYLWPGWVPLSTLTSNYKLRFWKMVHAWNAWLRMRNACLYVLKLN